MTRIGLNKIQCASFFVLMLCSNVSAQNQNLHEDPYWITLLHYETNIFFQKKSTIDDADFFLSPHGRKDPKAELDATLKAFLADEPEEIDGQHPACRYPARFYWLDSKMNLLSQMEPFECKRFKSWLEKLKPSAVSLIFSSYYMNNPASMYGHTFLKLSREGYDAGEGLLDYTVNYEAVTNTNNGVMFAVKGLMGGYRGRFSTTPYYIKVQQYNNMESRDIWEYKLDIDQDAVDQLVRHLWELGPNSMAYYFFNKNCSYQLLPLLEVAKPELKLARQFRFRAIPLDTLRSVLDVPGLVTDTIYRPSHTNKMIQRRDRLSEDEINLVEKFDAQKISSFPPQRQAHILDSAHDYLRYQHGFYRIQPDFVKQREDEILKMRNALNIKSEPLDVVPTVEAPHKGHNTLRLHVGVGENDDTTFEEFSARSAIHDLESNPTGFVNGSQLEMFNLRIRLENKRDKINFEQLTFIDIFSLLPWDRWVHPPSWHVRTSVEVARDLNIDAEDSLHYNLSGGSGFTFHIPRYKNGLVYFMWLAESGVGSVFDDDYRAGIGGLSGTLIQIGSRWRTHFSAAALRFPTGHVANKVKLKWVNNVSIARNFELRLTLERQNGYQEGMFTLNYYH